MKRNRQAGFTLTEILIAVVIVGIMATAAAMQYSKTVEISRRQAAIDILQTIYAGERVYNSLNPDFALIGVCDVAANWSKIYVDKPCETGDPVTFAVTAPGGAGTFLATATYTLKSSNNTLTIDQDRNMGPSSGAWAAP